MRIKSWRGRYAVSKAEAEGVSRSVNEPFAAPPSMPRTLMPEARRTESSAHSVWLRGCEGGWSFRVM